MLGIKDLSNALSRDADLVRYRRLPVPLLVERDDLHGPTLGVWDEIHGIAP